MSLFNRKRPSSILGLAWDGSQLSGAVLRRSNGSFKVQKTFAVILGLNPLAGDAELVGREIQNQLERAGIRERRCTVCIPASWASTQETTIPELSEEDVTSFLQIEAERGFVHGAETLSIADSRYRSPSGGQFATLVAVPKNYLFQLEKALRAARLIPVSFTLSITAIQPPDQATSEGVLGLLVGEKKIDLLANCGGGVVVLRSLDAPMAGEGGHRDLDTEAFAREVRITLGQMPNEFHDAIRKVRFYGSGDSVRRFADETTPLLREMGLECERIDTCSTPELAKFFPPETQFSPALMSAGRFLRGIKPCFEFLPPRTSAWKQFSSKVSSKKLFWASATAGAAALLIALAFVYQQWQLSRLQTRWNSMEKTVTEIDGMQQQIRKFRPWFDDSFASLKIIKKVTEAFPEEGIVTAKTLEIRNLSTVACTGTAQNNQAFLAMLDGLRATREIGEMKVDTIRGESPLHFAFNFRWKEGGGRED